MDPVSYKWLREREEKGKAENKQGRKCMRERINEVQGKKKNVSLEELKSNWLSSFHSHLNYWHWILKGGTLITNVLIWTVLEPKAHS